MNLLEDAVTTPPFDSTCFDERITLDISIQNMDAILDIVTTLGRVGAKIVAISALGLRVHVTFDARELVARRLPSLLATIVPVQEVTVLEGTL